MSELGAEHPATCRCFWCAEYQGKVFGWWNDWWCFKSEAAHWWYWNKHSVAIAALVAAYFAMAFLPAIGWLWSARQ